MKKNILNWVPLAILAVSITACSNPKRDDDVGSQGAQVDDRTSDSGIQDSGTQTQITGIQGSDEWQGNPLDNPDSLLSNRAIYFDFDQDVIRSEYIPTLQAHADYLSSHQMTLTIEGHADERGSREYNIGLGERRANAVKLFLEAEGVDPSSLYTLSYGEERPVGFGHNESAWSMNRRAELVY